MKIFTWVQKEPLNVSSEIQNLFSNHWVQQILTYNDIFTVEAAQRFIEPDYYTPCSGNEIPDLEIATDRLIRAIKTGEKIGVWGDFDVDGQTATTVLVQGLRNLGARVDYYIPVRRRESHGIKLDPLKTFLSGGISVLLTCDTGISEYESVLYAQQQGVDVLITDHHSLPDTLPTAMANVNPQRLQDDHPLKPLSGVGVAYKLIESLYKSLKNSDETDYLLDLVALGTVADVALLKGDNRFLVQNGLEVLKNTSRLGLKEIYATQRIQPGLIDETTIGFNLAPLMNALGRLADASPMVEFLTTDNLQKIRVFIATLDNLNERRKLITEQITLSIQSKLEKGTTLQNSPAIVLHQEGWEPGVLGIVANRIVDLYHKPVILLTGSPAGGYSGSARSIEKLNIIDAIQKNKAFLNHCGGHAMAAGLSLSADQLDAFTRNFNQTIAETYGDSLSRRQLFIDGTITFSMISESFVDELALMSPFGAGNPKPIFACNDLDIKNISTFGKKSEHIKITTTDQLNETREIIWWRESENSIPDQKVDIAFTVGYSTFKGVKNIQLEAVDIKPSERVLTELRSKQNKIKFLDFRNSQPENEDWRTQTENIFWYQEGIKEGIARYGNRSNTFPAEILVINTIPPSYNDLKNLVFNVMPRKIVFFANPPFGGTVNQLIKNVAMMINHIIHERMGLFDPMEIAIATGQRVLLIETILRYLEATGQISIYDHPDTQSFIKPGGIIRQENIGIYKEQIHFLMQETRSFYNWYKATKLETLVSFIISES